MNHFSFVHAADLHLDTPFEGIGRVPPLIAEALRDASLEAWDALVQLTIARGAACLLLAGDLYDGAQRGIRAQVRFLDGLERLSERGVQVFVVLGNHDPLEGWSAIPEWPAGVTVFRSDDVVSVPLIRDGVRLATVHGASYPRRDCGENLALAFQRDTEPGLQIGLLHCNVGAHAEHADYSPCSVGDLRQSGMDYWALGHIHRRTYLSTGDPWIVYPGNLQGRSPAVREQGPKGAVLVEVAGDAVRQVTFEALDQVRFVSLDLDVTGLDSAAVRRTLTEHAEQLRSEYDGRVLLTQAMLSGRSEGQRGLGRLRSNEALLQELRRDMEGDCPFVWWTAVSGAAPETIGRDAILRGEDLVSELLHYRQALASEPTRCRSFLDQRFEPLMRKWVAELEPGEMEDVLREAEALALDLLSGEESS